MKPGRSLTTLVMEMRGVLIWEGGWREGPA